MEPTFYVWEPVLAHYGLDYGDALMSHPLVWPIIHVLHDYPLATNYVPPGYTGSGSGDAPADVADVIEAWHAHHVANVVGKAYTDRPVYLCIHNAGNWNPTNPALSRGDNDTFGLFGHPDDIVAGINSTVAPFQAYLTNYRQGGIDFNATAHASIFADLDPSINLGWVDHDIEAPPPDSVYMTPAATANNWYTPFVSDGRFATEIAWETTTMDDAFVPVDANGDPVAFDTSQSIFHSSNNAVRSWGTQTFFPRLQAWSIAKAFGDPIKAEFPLAKVSNYDRQHYTPLENQPCYLDQVTLVDRTSRNELLDFDSIVLYEVYASFFIQSSKAAFEADVALKITQFGLTSTGTIVGDIRAISVARAKRLLTMSSLGGRAGNAHGWIRWMVQDNVLMSAWGYQWCYTLDDWKEIVEHALQLGFHIFILWGGNVAMPTTARDAWVALVNHAQAYDAGIGNPHRDPSIGDAVSFRAKRCPNVANVDLDPVITVTRTSGTKPFQVHVSACNTTTGDSLCELYRHVECRWELSRSNALNAYPNPRRGGTSSLDEQFGQERVFVIRDDGDCTLTLHCRVVKWDGTEYVASSDPLTLSVSDYAMANGENRWVDPAGNDANDGKGPRVNAGSFGFNGTTKRITQVGAFTSYDHDVAVAGDMNYDSATGGTGITPQMFKIVAKISNNEIEIDRNLGTTGTIANLTLSTGPKASYSTIVDGGFTGKNVHIRRGSTFTCNARLPASSGRRYVPYGPPGDGLINFDVADSEAANNVIFGFFTSGSLEDFVVAGIHFDLSSFGNLVAAFYTFGAVTIRDVLFLDTKQTGGTDGGISISLNDGSAIVERVALVGHTADLTGSTAETACYFEMTGYIAFAACNFFGGGDDPFAEHYVYLKNPTHFSAYLCQSEANADERSCWFKLRSKVNSAIPSRYMSIGDCVLSGTSVPIGFGDHSDPSGTPAGHDLCHIDGCVLVGGLVGDTESHGHDLAPDRALRLQVTNTDLCGIGYGCVWNNNGWDKGNIHITHSTLYKGSDRPIFKEGIPGLEVEDCIISGDGYYMEAQTGTSINGATFKRNRIHMTGGKFARVGGDVTVDFNEWQLLDKDTDSDTNDPAFPDAANGVFREMIVVGRGTPGRETIGWFVDGTRQIGKVATAQPVDQPICNIGSKAVEVDGAVITGDVTTTNVPADGTLLRPGIPIYVSFTMAADTVAGEAVLNFSNSSIGDDTFQFTWNWSLGGQKPPPWGAIWRNRRFH